MTLEELIALRAARLDPADLPHETTRRDAEAYARATLSLDHRLSVAKAALATLAELSNDDADTTWLAHLEAWRTVLCDELLAIASPIRDKQVLGRRQNLTVSIRCVDFGVAQFRDSGWELENCALGALMLAAGYEQVGADPARNLVGRLPWRGSIKETEQRLKDRARRKAQAEAHLDSALLDEAERERQEARSNQLRDVANSMNLRVGDLLVVRNGEAIDETTLTELQREALDFARKAFATST